MIEFVVGIDNGRGYTRWLGKTEKDGARWVELERKGAVGFSNMEEAEAAAAEFIQERLAAKNLFSNATSMAVGFKIETRLEITDGANLTEEQAQGLLDVLKRHYKQPVLPMSKFCDAISTWFRCIERVNRKEQEANPDEKTWRSRGARYYDQLRNIERDIRKSNLLARLLYSGEKLRTRECPEHKGKWSGCAAPGQGCPHGCGHTGWLPEPEVEVIT